MSTAIQANDSATFQREVLEADVPVMVDFWATWCGPCRTVAPELEAIAVDYGETIKVVKVDIDKARDVAFNYRIQAVPMIALFDRGKKVAESAGAKPRRLIESELGLSAVLARPER